jgi:hypothetical protein
MMVRSRADGPLVSIRVAEGWQMTSDNEDDGKQGFFKTRLFRSYVVIALLLGVFVLVRWWWPFSGAGEPGVEIVVTQEGQIEIAVLDGVDVDATCAYLMSSPDGHSTSDSLSIMSGVTQLIEASRTYPEGTVVSYAVTCLLGEEAFFDSGQITLSASDAPVP